MDNSVTNKEYVRVSISDQVHDVACHQIIKWSRILKYHLAQSFFGKDSLDDIIYLPV